MENFASTLDYQADRRPDKVVLTCGDSTLTNAQLFQRANALAAGLIHLGVRQGDIVAMLLPNGPEFMELIYAVNRIGAAFLPLNTRLAAAEWEYILRNSEAKAVVSDIGFAPQLDSVVPGLPGLTSKVVVGDAGTEGWLGYDDLVGSCAGARVPVADVSGSALQRLMYTSGTTSRPKGVCISHANLTWKNLGHMIEFGLTEEDVTAVAGPLYHVGALDMGGVATLHVGGSLVLQRRFDPAGLIGLIERHRATTVWLAPAMVSAVLREEEALQRADLGSLRVVMSGGEKMPEARLKQVLDLLPGVWFADAYGLTETVSSDTFMPFDSMLAKLGSVGKPLPHNQIRVADDQGASVPPGTVGEVLVRGPKVFSGYWRDPDATERAFVGGWFRTGDMGFLDEDGFLYIADRKKDMIVSGGENIATPEVERALYEHPDIVEAAVVGHADERWGEVPHAFIVVRAEAALTAADVAGFCRARLAGFKVPKYVTFVDELPRTASGKVVKRELRLMPEARRG